MFNKLLESDVSTAVVYGASICQQDAINWPALLHCWTGSAVSTHIWN